MKYNKWKEANDYWRMVIDKPFKIKGKNVMLLNYLENYYIRPNKSSHATKTMHRFINYLNNISREIYYCASKLNAASHHLIYKDNYRQDLLGINPYISITHEQVYAIRNFLNAFVRYNIACFHKKPLRKPLINSLLDAIDDISSIQDVLRQYSYNRTHKRKHPYLLIDGNYIEHCGYSNTQNYDNYKKLSLYYSEQKIDITKIFYKYNPLLDVYHIFDKQPYER